MKQKKTFEEKERTKQLIIFVWFVYAPKRTDLHGCQIANCPIESERRKGFSLSFAFCMLRYIQFENESSCWFCGILNRTVAH